MARNVQIIELKHHENFNLIEPGFVNKCKQNIEDYYHVYYGALNSLRTLKNEAEGALLLKGQDFLTEIISELEADMKEITSVCDSIHNMRLYDIAVEKRADILNAKQSKIQTEKDKAINARNKAQDKINSKSWFVGSSEYQNLCDTVNRSNRTINECDEDLAIIDKLRGKDYNEY